MGLVGILCLDPVPENDQCRRMGVGVFPVNQEVDDHIPEDRLTQGDPSITLTEEPLYPNQLPQMLNELRCHVAHTTIPSRSTLPTIEDERIAVSVKS